MDFRTRSDWAGHGVLAHRVVYRSAEIEDPATFAGAWRAVVRRVNDLWVIRRSGRESKAAAPAFAAETWSTTSSPSGVDTRDVGDVDMDGSCSESERAFRASSLKSLLVAYSCDRRWCYRCRSSC